MLPSSAQAKPKLKLSLEAELALISVNPANPPPLPGKNFQYFSVNVDKETLQEYIRTPIGQPQFLRKMEGDLNVLGKYKTTSILLMQMKRNILGPKLEDDLNLLGKWKTT